MDAELSSVETLMGPVAVTALGRTLMHEHLFNVGEEFQRNYVPEWDEDAAIQEVVDQLTELKALGIDTIVDPTVLGLGRNIERARQVGARVDVNVIVATGVYSYDSVPQQFYFRGPGMAFDEPEPLTALFVKDISEGIGETGVKAGLLKCAIDKPGLTAGVERIMRAAGQAHVQTGTPITVHTDAETKTGLIVQRVLAEEGVDLSKVVIGHSGDSTDLDYLCALAEAGSLLGMDRFGLDLFCSFEDRVATVIELVRRGFAEKIVISHDYACCNDLFPTEGRGNVLPDFHIAHISRDVIPELLRRGVTEGQLDEILIHNPARYFSRG
ncbi:MAG: phosphotriesterase [Nocardioidaceae bacterium]|nr:phosphotriesterase [Nocardioidaceae bacterium]